MKQELTDKIDQVEQRLTGRLDRLTVYAIENRELVEKMLTEEKFKVYFNEIMNSIDGLAKVVSRGEQERAATNARIDRVERDVDKDEAGNAVGMRQAELARPSISIWRRS